MLEQFKDSQFVSIYPKQCYPKTV